MQKLKSKAVLLLLLMQLIVLPPIAYAASAPASLYIPDTTLDISGIASPKALVQVYDGNALIGSLVANSNGIFSKHFPAMDTGLHPLRVVYTDKQGQLSTEVKDTINIQSQQNTSLEYFLPPTMSVAPETAAAGDFVAVSGSTAPNAVVEITLDGGGQILRPQAGADGRYSITFSTEDYYKGIHIARGHSILDQKASYSTAINSFRVESSPASQTEQGGGVSVPAIYGPPRIETDTSPVTITGSAEEGTQIILYVDGVIVGSTFARSDWSISLVPHSSYHKIQAIACRDGICSELSEAVELVFTGEMLTGGQPAICPAGFRLDEYRFWGVTESESISLSTLDIRGKQPYEWVVDWGDGTIERFNQHDGALNNLHHVYHEPGQFNGSVAMVDNDGCVYQRYFSVAVGDNPIDWRWMLFSVPLLLTGLGALIIRQQQLDNRKAAATVR